MATNLKAARDHTLTLDLLDSDVAKLYLDGRLELRSRLAARPGGSCSLVVEGAPPLYVGNISLSFTRTEDEERPVDNVVFVEDPFMRHWSSPQGAWVPAGSNSRFWHKGDFRGSFSVSIPFVHGTQLLFCTKRSKPASDPVAPLEP